MTSETISVKLGRQSYDILVGDGLIDGAAGAPPAGAAG